MKKIIDIISRDQVLDALVSNSNDIVVYDDSSEALLIASAFLSMHKTLIIVKPNQYQVTKLYQKLSTLINDTYMYTVDESFRVETMASSPELLIQRLQTMYTLTLNKPCIVILHVHSLVRNVPSVSLFKENILNLKVGMVFDKDELVKRIHQLGYQLEVKVTNQLQFASRGGVIDVYSINYDHPLRIEFFDDEIEDLRFFDVSSQKTIERISEVVILPASDVLYNIDEVNDVCCRIDSLFEEADLVGEAYDELNSVIELDKESLNNKVSSFTMYSYLGLFSDTKTIIDYLDDYQVIISNQKDNQLAYETYVSQSYFYYNELQEIGKTLKHLPRFIEYDIEGIQFTKFGDEKSLVFDCHQLEIDAKVQKILLQQIQDYCSKYDVVFCLENRHQVDMLIELLDSIDTPYTMITLKDQIYSGVNIYVGNLSFGVVLEKHGTVVISASELFNVKSDKKVKYFKYKDAKVIKDYQELHVGDYVVHDQHGIGQYNGIKTLEVQGCFVDYLYVSYLGEDSLYIPVDQFKLIRKYTGSEGKAPSLHKLGGSQWTKTKQRLKAQLNDIADTLLEIYAARMNQVGFQFNTDSELQLEFEHQFGYDLTPDQQTSINEIKNDMEKIQPMDRLLCGDVGFGKTEVALRAAFKAIVDSKQVAFLCPTTILSMQHYKTTIKRFEGFGVEVALLNRFTSTKERNRILKGILEGSIDILIGTHSILSSKVVFKDLGLLIIDEEQRFGVSQKEKIKEYRKTIDVLTLSATPIPRTLQMSLMNIRGLSKIDTPPKDRMPIQTYVVEKNWLLIKQVIERELSRDGQVFFLHNQTSTIDNVAYRISLEVPDARVCIGHGKMSKDELEDVMLRFINKEFNVLVCTTIIETGIDIPNANTILIDEADRFGLSQLYQIKGRVGRSNRVAYAYLLHTQNKQMNEEAVKRLRAIKEFTSLGSGYKIAMRDLSIRGAGDILGSSQAGFIDSVGFDMFMKLLEDTLAKKTGDTLEEIKTIEPVAISVNGYIPNDYVTSDFEKLEIYQKLDKATTLNDIVILEKEFGDYYGKLPIEVQTLIDKRVLDILSTKIGIYNIEQQNRDIEITFDTNELELDGLDIFTKVNQIFIKPSFKSRNGMVVISFRKQDNWLRDLNDFIKETINP